MRPSERPLIGWLTPAIAALAEQNDALAAGAILELLPAQAGDRGANARPYTLTIEGFGTDRVAIDRERTSIDRREDASGADVHVIGSAGALAPLVGGGARRRLRGVRIEGRKRRLRKVVRARRAPLDFARAGRPRRAARALSSRWPS